MCKNYLKLVRYSVVVEDEITVMRSSRSKTFLDTDIGIWQEYNTAQEEYIIIILLF